MENKAKTPYEVWLENTNRGKEYIKRSRTQPTSVKDNIAWQRKMDEEAGISNPSCGISFQQLKETGRG